MVSHQLVYVTGMLEVILGPFRGRELSLVPGKLGRRP